MGDVFPAPRDASPVSTADDRLDSWKEIAAYLKRDVSTVQRWEKKEGLPVHRLPHDKLGSVFAFKPELDAWWNRARQHAEPVESGTSKRTAWRLIVGLGALAGVLLLVAGLLLMWRTGSGVRTPARAHLSIPLPPGNFAHVQFSSAPAVAVSRDGTKVAYVGWNGERRQIYLRSLDREEAVPVTGTLDGHSPFFSPDGRSLGFVSGHEPTRVKRVPLQGGPVTELCRGRVIRGAVWTSDDAVFVTPDSFGSDLWRVAARGGPCEAIAKTDRGKGEWTIRFPEALPGGRVILLTTGSEGMDSWDDGRIDVLRLDTVDRRTVLEGAMLARYASPGYLLFARGGSIFAAPFDAERLVVTGPRVKILEGVVTSPTSGDAQFAVSDTGTLVYLAGPQAGVQRRLIWVDRQGRETPISKERAGFYDVVLSPDNRFVGLHLEGFGADPAVYDIGRGTLTKLPSRNVYNSTLVFTRDGRRVIYGSGPPGLGLFWQPADGSGAEECLIAAKEGVYYFPDDWSPDGRVLLFQRTDEGNRDLWTLRLSDRKVERLVGTPFNERQASFSPDGRYVAYAADDTGRFEVYVRPFPQGGRRWRVSSDGGILPLWSRAGGELFYRDGVKGRMMAVDVTTGPEFSAGQPRVLFERRQTTIVDSYYDVAADGQRFVMVDTSEEPAPTHVTVILNWIDLLRGNPAGQR
jgi:serine/threonine-protein kinase